MRKLSLVVVGYNMARELPRTLRTLSPSMQRGMEADDYEVILVDNGSTLPFDEAECRRWIPGLIVHRMENASVSPVGAINAGLALAKGEVVGVFIDGARMASPGLLHAALTASRLDDRAVIGTFAFHLGPKVQMQSVREGYDQRAEDALLRASGWEQDGYRLFDISAFAGSSSQGWLALPHETNALFLKRKHWRELGGYDPRFVSPGGGLANLDIWRRLVCDPRNLIVMLLGEGTFHQVHGGIATNAKNPPIGIFEQEYLELRGEPYRPPSGEPIFFGALNRHALASMEVSLQAFRQKHSRRASA